MREILFRGKSEKLGNWIEGSLIVGRDLESGQLEYLIAPLSAYYTEVKKVIPETVGQYTGLTDKNGKKIFEGDIARLFGENLEELIVFFVWNKERAMFMCRTIENEPCDFYVDKSDFFVLLGNIHDNPELLKGE